MTHEQFRIWRSDTMAATTEQVAHLLGIDEDLVIAFEAPPLQPHRHQPIPAPIVKLINLINYRHTAELLGEPPTFWQQFQVEA